MVIIKHTFQNVKANKKVNRNAKNQTLVIVRFRKVEVSKLPNMTSTSPNWDPIRALLLVT